MPKDAGIAPLYPKQYSLVATSMTSALEVIFYNERHYIHLRVSYLLTFTFT